MALFGSSEKSAPELKSIRPIIVRTQNVAKELLQIAKSNSVAASSLDFNLIEVQTYTKVNKDNVEVDWEEIEEDRLHEIDDLTAILNQRFEIKQIYEIEIYSKDSDNSVFKDFHAAVGANATKCKVYLSIKAGSKVKLVDNIEEKFLDYINKSKIRAGILIHIFDDMVDEFISKAAENAKANGELVYENKETVLISSAYEPTPTIDDELILHYDKDSDVGENEKVDYSQRGFIKSVSQDDLLIEYIKPQIGKPGRNCRGEFMEPTKPVEVNAPTFTVDETIIEIDEKDSIKYQAKESGYIALEGTMYQIKSDMDINSIDFRSTGSITAGVDSDIILNVKENDPEKDAIGSGMEVAVKEIDIVGNVGSHAKVSAKRVNIEGQTHKSSIITADDLTINVHKGTAIGDTVSINRLESGTVSGKKVTVTQATGGQINAKEIELLLCVSHIKATASKVIEIHKLQGSENIFTIDPLVQDDKEEGLDENKSEIKALEFGIRDIKKEIEKYTKIVKNNMTSFNDVKRRLVHYKKNGIKMPSSFVNKYKQFKKIGEHLESIKQECTLKEDRLLLLTTKTASFQDNIFDARVINRDKWVGHNEIVFKLVDPPINISFSPQEGSTQLVFALVEVEEGEYEIKAVEE